MKYALLADIHANLEALKVVLDDIDRNGGAEEFWLLGDLVNYGPDPCGCLDLLLDLPMVAVAGNHDLASIGLFPTDYFNPEAAAALTWTMSQLRKCDRDYLASLPISMHRHGFTLVHGTPEHPADEYLMTVQQAEHNFGLLETPHACVGHTHVPAVYKREQDGNVRFMPFRPCEPRPIAEGRFIVNPGSVGQPRNGDFRAAYALYDVDTQTMHLRRIPYNLEATQAKMTRAGLPQSLIDRLEIGR
ncbi:metallophosphoesterase family protein [Dehalogenimonas etheniformans]|uniref:Metallophosphoesterase n=1 Tax=Dehalogenimonas etheniformans TaxID=1536648 RepID=A0A2P5P7D1_9CHLR|nr:metallophosphoesterase family protein [Dehalogenimonas etheniformans]PPD58195.1 metallophosphoesterase [Dehalogenimonas etheniformans]QNT75604.1 metallophosphoesterase family protein [Dehalogenimonas etheniformans]